MALKTAPKRAQERLSGAFLDCFSGVPRGTLTGNLQGFVALQGCRFEFSKEVPRDPQNEVKNGLRKGAQMVSERAPATSH